MLDRFGLDHVHVFGSVRSNDIVILSMMPKSRHGFSEDIMLDRFGLDHVHVFGSVRSNDIVILSIRQARTRDRY